MTKTNVFEVHIEEKDAMEWLDQKGLEDYCLETAVNTILKINLCKCEVYFKPYWERNDD